MRVTLMANKTEWSPEEDYSTEVRFWEDDYIVKVAERIDDLHQDGSVEIWMSREQLETHIITLQAALELPQINNAKVSSKEVQAKAEVQVEAPTEVKA